MQFAAWGIPVASSSAVVAFAFVRLLDLPLPWALAGWLPAAAIGLGGGAWLAAAHGRAGSAFLAALGTSTAARFASLAVGTVLALRSGRPAAGAFLTGFGVVFAAFSVFEWLWFTRAARSFSTGLAAGAGQAGDPGMGS